MRAQVEETLLSWAIDRESDSWNVNADTGEFSVLCLKWHIEEIAFDVLPLIIWKVVGLLHARLTASTDEVGLLLQKVQLVHDSRQRPSCVPFAESCGVKVSSRWAGSEISCRSRSGA